MNAPTIDLPTVWIIYNLFTDLFNPNNKIAAYIFPGNYISFLVFHFISVLNSLLWLFLSKISRTLLFLLKFFYSALFHKNPTILVWLKISLLSLFLFPHACSLYWRNLFFLVFNEKFSLFCIFSYIVSYFAPLIEKWDLLFLFVFFIGNFFSLSLSAKLFPTLLFSSKLSKVALFMEYFPSIACLIKNSTRCIFL